LKALGPGGAERLALHEPEATLIPFALFAATVFTVYSRSEITGLSRFANSASGDEFGLRGPRDCRVAIKNSQVGCAPIVLM
jgi:hypothetical protein